MKIDYNKVSSFFAGLSKNSTNPSKDEKQENISSQDTLKEVVKELSHLQFFIHLSEVAATPIESLIQSIYLKITLQTINNKKFIELSRDAFQVILKGEINVTSSNSNTQQPQLQQGNRQRNHHHMPTSDETATTSSSSSITSPTSECSPTPIKTPASYLTPSFRTFVVGDCINYIPICLKKNSTSVQFNSSSASATDPVLILSIEISSLFPSTFQRLINIVEIQQEFIYHQMNIFNSSVTQQQARDIMIVCKETRFKKNQVLLKHRGSIVFVSTGEFSVFKDFNRAECDKLLLDEDENGSDTEIDPIAVQLKELHAQLLSQKSSQQERKSEEESLRVFFSRGKQTASRRVILIIKKSQSVIVLAKKDTTIDGIQCLENQGNTLICSEDAFNSICCGNLQQKQSHNSNEVNSKSKRQLGLESATTSSKNNYFQTNQNSNLTSNSNLAKTSSITNIRNSEESPKKRLLNSSRNKNNSMTEIPKERIMNQNSTTSTSNNKIKWIFPAQQSSKQAGISSQSTRTKSIVSNMITNSVESSANQSTTQLTTPFENLREAEFRQSLASNIGVQIATFSKYLNAPILTQNAQSTQNPLVWKEPPISQQSQATITTIPDLNNNPIKAQSSSTTDLGLATPNMLQSERLQRKGSILTKLTIPPERKVVRGSSIILPSTNLRKQESARDIIDKQNCSSIINNSIINNNNNIQINNNMNSSMSSMTLIPSSNSNLSQHNIHAQLGASLRTSLTKIPSISQLGSNSKQLVAPKSVESSPNQRNRIQIKGSSSATTPIPEASPFQFSNNNSNTLTATASPLKRQSQHNQQPSNFLEQWNDYNFLSRKDQTKSNLNTQRGDLQGGEFTLYCQTAVNNFMTTQSANVSPKSAGLSMSPIGRKISRIQQLSSFSQSQEQLQQQQQLFLEQQQKQLSQFSQICTQQVAMLLQKNNTQMNSSIISTSHSPSKRNELNNNKARPTEFDETTNDFETTMTCSPTFIRNLNNNKTVGGGIHPFSRQQQTKFALSACSSPSKKNSKPAELLTPTTMTQSHNQSSLFAIKNKKILSFIKKQKDIPIASEVFSPPVKSSRNENGFLVNTSTQNSSYDRFSQILYKKYLQMQTTTVKRQQQQQEQYSDGQQQQQHDQIQMQEQKQINTQESQHQTKLQQLQQANLIKIPSQPASPFTARSFFKEVSPVRKSSTFSSLISRV